MNGTPEPPTFGRALKAALRDSRITQAELARELNVDPGQVSRWATDKAVPHTGTVTRIEGIVQADLSDAFRRSTPTHELYVSAPITGLEDGGIADHRADVAKVVAAARLSVNGVYWPGEYINGRDDLVASDLATEKNLRTLAGCHSFLYLQFGDVVHPSGALIELGLAMGRKCKTTIILRRGLKWPYMFGGLPAVAAGLNFLPQARLYEVDSVEEAAGLVSKNGRLLLGLS